MSPTQVGFPSCLQSDVYQLMEPASTDAVANRRAAHVFFYAKVKQQQDNPAAAASETNKNSTRFLAMMMIRSDGNFGFPGGIIEEGESVLEGLNRETLEEVGVDLHVRDKDFLCCHVTQHQQYGKIELHAYAKEVSLEQFCHIERNVCDAKHFGVETYGITRVPLFSREDGKGLPTFLRNTFSGNAKTQLLYALYAHDIVSLQTVKAALGILEGSS